MATFYGEKYNVAENFSPATENPGAVSTWGGKLRIQVDKRKVTANEVDFSGDDTIRVAKIPKGGTVLYARLKAANLEAANGGELNLGYGANSNQFVADANANAAIDVNTGWLMGVGAVTMSEDTDITIKPANAVAADKLKANETLETLVVYAID